MPNTRMAAITSVVVIGRLMKSDATFMQVSLLMLRVSPYLRPEQVHRRASSSNAIAVASSVIGACVHRGLPLVFYLHLGAILQSHLTVSDDRLSRRESIADNRIVPISASH